MDFDVSGLPDHFAGEYWSVAVTQRVDLDAGQIDRIISGHGVDAETLHARAYQPFERDRKTFEVYGFIGVHPATESRPPYVHLEIRARTHPRPASEKGEGCELGTAREFVRC